MIGTSRNCWGTILMFTMFAYFLLTLSLGLSYHWGYMSSLKDLGTFDQAIWATLSGNVFYTTTNSFNMPVNYLGIHFRPILLIFLPFYALLPRAEWMILAQSLALPLTAWPIYLLAKRVSNSESAAFFWSLTYMVNPFVISVLPWVFRPESLAVPFFAIALLAIEKSNFRLLLLSCLLIVLCKEHFGVTVIGFGILWGLRNREWKQSILLGSLGAMYSMLVLGVVMPSLSPIGKHVMLGEGLGQLSRYSWLGDSFPEVFKTLLFHPIFVFKKVMLEMGGGSYLFVLLTPFLLFPMAAPTYLLPGLTDLMANILSFNPMPRSIVAYHSVCLVPVLTVAAVYGGGRISRWRNKFTQKELASFVLIASFILGYYWAPLPLPGSRNIWSPANILNWPDPKLPGIRSVVGDNSSVSAQYNIGAHFSQRLEIYQYPNKVSEVDTIVLRLEIPTTGYAALHQHLGMELSEYLASIERLLAQKEYGILLWNDPWLVMGKGRESQQSTQVREVKNKLKQLRNLWET